MAAAHEVTVAHEETTQGPASHGCLCRLELEARSFVRRSSGVGSAYAPSAAPAATAYKSPEIEPGRSDMSTSRMVGSFIIATEQAAKISAIAVHLPEATELSEYMASAPGNTHTRVQASTAGFHTDESALARRPDRKARPIGGRVDRASRPRPSLSQAARA